MEKSKYLKIKIMVFCIRTEKYPNITKFQLLSFIFPFYFVSHCLIFRQCIFRKCIYLKYIWSGKFQMEPEVFRIAMKSIWTSFLAEGQSVSKADKTHTDGRSQGHLLSPALVAQQLLSQRFLHLLDALLMGNQHQFPESHKTDR